MIGRLGKLHLRVIKEWALQEYVFFTEDISNNDLIEIQHRYKINVDSSTRLMINGIKTKGMHHTKIVITLLYEPEK